MKPPNLTPRPFPTHLNPTPQVRDLLGAVLGEGSLAHLPAAWLRDTFSWDHLGDFSLETSLDSLLEPEALSSLLDRPTDLADLTNKLDLTRDAFCKIGGCAAAGCLGSGCRGLSAAFLIFFLCLPPPELCLMYSPSGVRLDASSARARSRARHSLPPAHRLAPPPRRRSFEPPEKKPTKCMGPQVVLELEPKTCEIDPAAKVIACTPARLVLRKVPGECALKHLTPASWSGKECKVTITVRLLTTCDSYWIHIE